ncbi:MAG TPA: nodulation protein NfeD, partial [Clostridiales bacterium]|nr:nodulation protein NfeD [Clostridiales bacterium]
MKQHILKRVFFVLLIFCFLMGSGYDAHGQSRKNVYVIPIEGEINPANAQFINHSIEKAESDPESVCIIFEIDTLGGRVDQAIKIRDKIMSTS